MLAILELYIFQHVYRVKYCSSFHFPPQCKFHWLQWMAFRSVKKWQESILCRRWPTDWKWKVFNGLCRKTTICEDLRILVAKNKKDFRGSCIQASGPLMNDSKTMSGRLRDFHCIMQSWINGYGIFQLSFIFCAGQALTGSKISIPGFFGTGFCQIPGSRDFSGRDFPIFLIPGFRKKFRDFSGFSFLLHLLVK